MVDFYPMAIEREHGITSKYPQQIKTKTNTHRHKIENNTR